MNKILFRVNADYQFDRQVLRKKINNFLAQQGLQDVELSIAVVGQRKMRQLNQEYLDRDKVSDVLAFSQKESRRPDGVMVIGDIVVCFPKVKEEALAYQEKIDETMWDFVRHGLDRLME